MEVGNMAEAKAKEVATLGGGCFWCLEAVFEQLRGVESVVSGYAGGHVPNPTYEQVCGKGTGHVRPGSRFVPRGAGGVLRHPRPDDEGPARQRCRAAIPLGDLHPLRRAE